MRHRRVIVALAVLALLIAAGPHNRADIRILTHESSDRAPEKIQAAIDLGWLAVSVLITWTRRLG
jgi:hypothetical protein